MALFLVWALYYILVSGRTHQTALCCVFDPRNVPPMGHMLKASLLGYYFVFWGIYPLKTCIYLCSHRFGYANQGDILLFFWPGHYRLRGSNR